MLYWPIQIDRVAKSKIDLEYSTFYSNKELEGELIRLNVYLVVYSILFKDNSKSNPFNVR